MTAAKRTFKALGALLTYPEDALIAALPEIAAVLDDERLLAPAARRSVQALLDHLAGTDPIRLQEDYVGSFDRTRTLSLHFYEHLYGESRDRGQAMAELATVYRLHGFEIDQGELPDFLPLVCEFLSLIDEGPARAILADAVTTLEALRVRLAERGSPYAAALEALVDLAGRTADPKLLAQVLAGHPTDEDSFEAIDKAWKDAPVRFGPSADPRAEAHGCGPTPAPR